MSATFQFGPVPFGVQSSDCNVLDLTAAEGTPGKLYDSASSHSRLLVGICFRVSLCFIEFVLLPTPPAAFAWLGLLLGLSLVLRKRHPFANDFSMRLVCRLLVQIPLF
jgi:hypothetical protein